MLYSRSFFHRRVSRCLCAVLQKLPATRIHLPPHLLSVSVAVGIVVPESLCRPISAISTALSHRIHHFNSKPTSFLRVSSFPLLGPANSVARNFYRPVSQLLVLGSSPPRSFSHPLQHHMYAVTSGPTTTPHSNSPFPRLSNLLFYPSSYLSLVSPVTAAASRI